MTQEKKRRTERAKQKALCGIGEGSAESKDSENRGNETCVYGN